MKSRLTTLLLCLTIGCSDAPRDNPLDPASPSYAGEATVSGSVILKDQGIPISLAQVRILEEGIAVTSDSTGHFSCRLHALGQSTLVCTKDNFTPDTQHVSLTAGATQSVTFLLNGAPVVLAHSILTRKVDQYYPSPQYYVDVAAEVTDPNGITDLDSVSFVVSSLVYPMDYVPAVKQFQARVFKYDIPTNTIEWLVGKPLSIVSTDRSGARNTSEPFYVTRVIETGATPVYPSSLNSDTTNGTPLLHWVTPTVTFPFSYTLGISRVDAGTQTIVWTVAGVNSLLNQYQYPADGSVSPLDAGDHVWTVTVVDQFGNTCRSKESFFVVR
jgi:hypothetical protein